MGAAGRARHLPAAPEPVHPMIPASLLLPLVIGALATAGFAANEWTHGGVSEELGMGHHHMLDHPLHACHGSEGNGSAPGPMHEGMRCAPAEG